MRVDILSEGNHLLSVQAELPALEQVLTTERTRPKLSRLAASAASVLVDLFRRTPSVKLVHVLYHRYLTDIGIDPLPVSRRKIALFLISRIPRDSEPRRALEAAVRLCTHTDTSPSTSIPLHSLVASLDTLREALKPVFGEGIAEPTSLEQMLQDIQVHSLVSATFESTSATLPLAIHSTKPQPGSQPTPSAAQTAGSSSSSFLPAQSVAASAPQREHVPQPPPQPPRPISAPLSRTPSASTDIVQAFTRRAKKLLKRLERADREKPNLALQDFAISLYPLEGLASATDRGWRLVCRTVNSYADFVRNALGLSPFPITTDKIIFYILRITQLPSSAEYLANIPTWIPKRAESIPKIKLKPGPYPEAVFEALVEAHEFICFEWNRTAPKPLDSRLELHEGYKSILFLSSPGPCPSRDITLAAQTTAPPETALLPPLERPPPPPAPLPTPDPSANTTGDVPLFPVAPSSRTAPTSPTDHSTPALQPAVAISPTRPHAASPAKTTTLDASTVATANEPSPTLPGPRVHDPSLLIQLQAAVDRAPPLRRPSVALLQDEGATDVYQAQEGLAQAEAEAVEARQHVAAEETEVREEVEDNVVVNVEEEVAAGEEIEAEVKVEIEEEVESVPKSFVVDRLSAESRSPSLRLAEEDQTLPDSPIATLPSLPAAGPSHSTASSPPSLDQPIRSATPPERVEETDNEVADEGAGLDSDVDMRDQPSLSAHALAHQHLAEATEAALESVSPVPTARSRSPSHADDDDRPISVIVLDESSAYSPSRSASSAPDASAEASPPASDHSSSQHGPVQPQTHGDDAASEQTASSPELHEQRSEPEQSSSPVIGPRRKRPRPSRPFIVYTSDEDDLEPDDPPQQDDDRDSSIEILDFYLAPPSKDQTDQEEESEQDDQVSMRLSIPSASPQAASQSEKMGPDAEVGVRSVRLLPDDLVGFEVWVEQKRQAWRARRGM